MGIKSTNHIHHHHHHHHNQISSLNLALCLRPPLHPHPPPKILVKDIINTLPSNKTLVMISSDDSLMVLPPCNRTRDQEVQLRLSPRIGCMGQIKRSSSCRNSSSSSSSSSNKKKLFQFQRMFSNISRKSTSRGGVSARVEDDCSNISSGRQDDDISIADTMDLPLPVTERRRRDAGTCSIWERRHGGAGTGLRLQGMEHLRESFWQSKDCCRMAA